MAVYGYRLAKVMIVFLVTLIEGEYVAGAFTLHRRGEGLFYKLDRSPPQEEYARAEQQLLEEEKIRAQREEEEERERQREEMEAEMEADEWYEISGCRILDHKELANENEELRSKVAKLKEKVKNLKALLLDKEQAT